MAYYVYVLRSEKDGSYYIGHTSDPEERLKRHSERRSGYTRNKAPWKLIYKEAFSTRSEAMQRERDIKRKKSRAYIDHLVRAFGV